MFCELRTLKSVLLKSFDLVGPLHTTPPTPAVKRGKCLANPLRSCALTMLVEANAAAACRSNFTAGLRNVCRCSAPPPPQRLPPPLSLSPPLLLASGSSSPVAVPRSVALTMPPNVGQRCCSAAELLNVFDSPFRFNCGPAVSKHRLYLGCGLTIVHSLINPP